MPKPTIAFLWDESFLWALMAYRSFKALGLDPVIVTSADVRAGALDGFDILFVPGGWASDKTVALGEVGAEAVRGFVRGGGSYMGFCGGAGLALDVQGGLALTHVSRVPTKSRVPSFSGEITLTADDTEHHIWRGIRRPYNFHVWWPGQFHMGEGDGVRVVARYGKPGRDFCLADLTADDVERFDNGWESWEQSYGINLDPARLVGEPAIIEADYGAGRVFLSYPHLETPGSRKGNRALLNIVEHLKKRDGGGGPSFKRGGPSRYPVSKEAREAAVAMERAMREFIAFGERNFLWYWRTSWVLQWRRGVRGVEYSALRALVGEIAASVGRGSGVSDPEFSEKLIALIGRLNMFLDEAKSLLLRERHAMMAGGMSSISSHDPEVEHLRERLFSRSKRFGGEFKAILSMLDEAVRGTMG